MRVTPKSTPKEKSPEKFPTTGCQGPFGRGRGCYDETSIIRDYKLQTFEKSFTKEKLRV